MRSILPSRAWPIGLDLGSSGVRMMQLAGSSHGVSVVACAQRHLPEGSCDDPAEHRRRLIEAARELRNSHSFRGRRVVSALPPGQVALRSIRLPHMPEHELAEAVRWEASERFGFDVTPDRLAYLPAGQVRQGADIQDEVILAAVREDAVESHLSLLAEIGLRVEHIDFEPAATFRVFERYLRRRADENNVNVIVEIGYGSTRVIVARGRQIVFFKSIDIGGRKLTESVSRSLNMSYKEAHDLRLLTMRDESRPDAQPVNENVSWTLSDALRAQAEALGREIALCLRYCSVTFRGLRAESATIVGGQAYDPVLLRLLSEHLSMPCVVGQPLRGIDVSCGSFSGNRRGTLAEWSVCAGLAMYGQKIVEPVEDTDNEQHRLSA